MKKIIIFILLILLPKVAICETYQFLIDEAKNKNLSNSSVWKALLHVDSRVDADEGSEISQVVTNTFFLAPNGKDHPEIELEATIKAYFEEINENINEHARCRFPARYIWLKQSLDWTDDGRDIACTEFEKWKSQDSIKGISLVFATGYLGNPASFYGHLLLRFHNEHNQLLSKSVDYGAIIDKNDNAVVYIFKGLFGFYDAGFSDGNFYEKNHNYGENELRDLWDYELDLPEAEREFIIAHLWEMMPNKMQYYFTRKNCASVIAELIELIIDEPLYTRGQPWVAPITIFNRISEVNYKGKPLVKKITRIPSRESRLVEKYDRLNDKLKKIVADAIDAKMQGFEKYTENLSVREKQEFVEIIMDYYQYLLIKEIDIEKNKKRLQKAHAYRLSLPVSEWDWQINNKQPPHSDQKPSLFQMSRVETNDKRLVNEFRIRPAYFDYLNDAIGHPEYAQLSMVDLRLRTEGSSIELESIDLVKVETLNVSKTGLPHEGGAAWKVRFGYEKNNLNCQYCSALFLEGGYGIATELHKGYAIFTMIEGRIQENQNDYGVFSVTPRVGTVLISSDYWKSYLSIGKRKHINSGITEFEDYEWETRFGNRKNWDIRIKIRKSNNIERMVGVSFYW